MTFENAKFYKWQELQSWIVALSIIRLSIIVFSIMHLFIMLPFREICGLKPGRAAFREVRGGEKYAETFAKKEYIK